MRRKEKFFDNLYDEVKSFVDDANRQATEDNYRIHRDREHYLYEDLINNFLGREYWDWFNENMYD